MKSFKDLSLNISEEEYRNNGRYHYSDIAGYMKEGFSYLVKPHKEESESLTFGSLVDCIVTEGIDRFNEKYCVEKEFNLSDNQKTVIRELLHFGYERLEDIPPQTIIEDLQTYYKNPKSQLSKLIEEGGEYYRFMYGNKGKTAVEFQMFQDAIDTANVLLTNDITREFFGEHSDNINIFYQLKFNGEYDGIPITCMPDIIYIDHSVKKIWILDLKTTCVNYEWEFPKSFVKYRYDVQAKQYSMIVRQIMDNDDFYKDYTLEGFIFLYISRMNKNPLAWTFDKLGEEDIEITTKNGNKIVLEDFRKVLKKMSKETGEELPSDISKINNVMDHLNDCF